MSYGEVRKEIAAKMGTETVNRSNYRCAANGCPNAGAIDDTGPGTGKCYFHWREPEPRKWDAITHKIRQNFEKMRNFDNRAAI